MAESEVPPTRQDTDMGQSLTPTTLILPFIQDHFSVITVYATVYMSIVAGHVTFHSSSCITSLKPNCLKLFYEHENEFSVL